jgi:rRNA maturation protein Nop10
MKKLIKLKNGMEKCPHCGTTFAPESLHPFDVAVRKEFKKRRSKAAKRGWKTRRKNECGLEDSLIDLIKCFKRKN